MNLNKKAKILKINKVKTNIIMDKKIENYQKKWDSIIRSFDGSFRSNEDVDEFFSTKFYKHSKPNEKLNDKALPEPYLGDPYVNSIVCLNLNPGQFLENFQDPKNGIFVTKGNAIDSYSKFAKDFPYLTEKYKIKNDNEQNGGHKWWEKRNEYFKRLFNYEGNNLPFAIEVCPWRSSKFGSLKYTREFLKYVEDNVFDLASEVSLNSDIKLVFSVGAPYRILFEKLPSRFVRIIEITEKNAKNHGFSYPVKENGSLVNRRISIWQDKKYNVTYVNTSAQGGNKNPAKYFDKIILKLIKENQ